MCNYTTVDFAHTYPNPPTDKTLDTNFSSALASLVSLWTNIASFGREIYENQRCNKSGVWSKVRRALRARERRLTLMICATGGAVAVRSGTLQQRGWQHAAADLRPKLRRRSCACLHVIL